MPAAGYRLRETGALGGVGSEGNVWSSSSYAAGNITAGRLNVLAGNVYPLGTGGRANAFSVRCVQHLRGELFKKLLPVTLRRSGVAV